VSPDHQPDCEHELTQAGDRGDIERDASDEHPDDGIEDIAKARDCEQDAQELRDITDL